MTTRRTIHEVLVTRFSHGDDLLASLQQYIKEENITSAWVNILGAVATFSFLYFDQEMKQYVPHHTDEHLEILNATGNIALKEGKPFPHIHITCSDRSGTTIGGHLDHGTTIFMAEAIFWILDGAPLRREEDPSTNLWPLVL